MLIGVTYLCYNNTGSDLLPAMDEGGFIVRTTSCPRVRRWPDQPRDHAHRERFSAGNPEVESASRRTGLQLGLAQVTEANTGDVSW